MSYEPDNIFAKILRGEIPCTPVYEDDHVLAFPDIAPAAPVHILVIPKGAYTDMSDFAKNASAQEQTALNQAVVKIIDQQNLTQGYRLISNTGTHGGQQVPHLHWHILGGEVIGSLRVTA